MAELRNAEASVAALESPLSALRQFRDEHAEEVDVASVERLRGALQAMTVALEGDVHATMDRFRQRMKQVDPITNEPRFGPKTMARVSEMLQKYDAVYEEVVGRGLLEMVRRRIEAFDAEQAVEAARAEELQRQQAIAREAELLRQETERKREEMEREMQQQRELEAERQRVAELARLAQLKREERERQRLAEEAQAKQEQERLARDNARAEVGVVGLSNAVERLRAGLHGDAALFRKTLLKLQILLANVCASPENTAFRHIPKDNVHFHGDIGQHDGGHACLLAMGFKELELEPRKRVFIMEEPDLSEDFDKWSNWFEGLKEMKEWLENATPPH